MRGLCTAGRAVCARVATDGTANAAAAATTTSRRRTVMGASQSQTIRNPKSKAKNALSFAPFQLLAQHFEIAAGRCLDEAKPVLCLTHGDHVAFLQLVAELPVVGDEDIVHRLVDVRPDLDRFVAGNHDGAVR